MSVLIKIKRFFSPPIDESYKAEFIEDVYKVNVFRGKVSAITCLIIDLAAFIAFLVSKKGMYFDNPNLYYGLLYILMLVTTAYFALYFIRTEKKDSGYSKKTCVFVTIFACFLLLWSAAFSLLDQYSNGQIIVYSLVIMVIAAAPFFRPTGLLLILASVHTIFLFLLPNFQLRDRLVFVNGANSSIIVVVGWMVAWLRYKRHIGEFTRSKLMLKKTEDLSRVNQELKVANEKLELLTRTDCLTGIYNRLMLDDKLEEGWNFCKRHKKPISLIMADIDCFKLYNDHYGHQAGDECLKKVAEVLQTSVMRAGETVTRYGGEEFMILLPVTEMDEAITLAETIRKKVEELNIPHEYSIVADHLTISLGVDTVIPTEDNSIDRLIHNVDLALYVAKRTRNSTAVSAEKLANKDQMPPSLR